jgi:hypothetical protein
VSINSEEVQRAIAAGIEGEENHAHATNDILQWNAPQGLKTKK